MTNTILAAVSTFVPLLLLIDVLALGHLKESKSAGRSGKLILLGGITSAFPLLVLFATSSQTAQFITGTEPLGDLIRFDTLSTIMFIAVSIIGFVVLRFSESYLAGEKNQVAFFRKLLFTIALVQVLVLSGSLITLFVAWVATSFGLKSLILHYKDRPRAQLAAKKNFLIARMSDLSLLVSLGLLYSQFGTANLELIFEGLRNINLDSVPANLELSAIFLVLAAVIKSVQVPFHGWILDVMEAPTPVSGLLHAGLLNAGPFLIIRFSFLMDISTIAPIVLLGFGALSAIYGTIVYPTQPAVKTSLAYSSIGHMGFSLMIAGMGLYSASLLHLVAHSFYKAHSFLSSGSAIDRYRLKQMDGKLNFKATFWHALIGFIITGTIFLLINSALEESHQKNFQILVLGAIIVAGVSSYMIRTLGTQNSTRSTFKAIAVSSMVLLAFFTFESAIGAYLGAQIPDVAQPGLWLKAILTLVLIAFVSIIFIAMFRSPKSAMKGPKWQIYKRNGFYIHVIFDRFLQPVYSKVRS